MAGLSGIVKNLAIPWLFQDIKNDKKTGTAVLEKDGAIKKIYFSNGDIVFASSSLNEDRLAEFLVRTGKITAEQRDTLIEAVRTSGKQEGTVLIERCIVRPADLVDQVNQQVKQIILDLFTWRNGTYQFNEGSLPQAEIIPLSMTTASVILDGVGALDWQVIRRVLPPPETVLRPAAVPPRLFRVADLTPEQKNIYAMINGSRTIEELCSLSVVGDFNTYKAIYALLAVRMVEPGTAEDARMSTRDTGTGRLCGQRGPGGRQGRSHFAGCDPGSLCRTGQAGSLSDPRRRQNDHPGRTEKSIFPAGQALPP